MVGIKYTAIDYPSDTYSNQAQIEGFACGGFTDAGAQYLNGEQWAVVFIYDKKYPDVRKGPTYSLHTGGITVGGTAVRLKSVNSLAMVSTNNVFGTFEEERATGEDATGLYMFKGGDIVGAW